VHAVITAPTFQGSATCIWACHYADRHPLAVDKVRFYGEEVAAVAADSAALARQALALIVVEYEPLPAALTPEAALRADAPAVHDGALTAAGRNLAIRFACDYGDVAGAFAGAAHVFEDEFSHGIAVPACMETNGTVARFDPATGELALWTATQAPFFVRKEVAHVLGLDVERVHIRGVEVGGGFGGQVKVCEQEAIAARLSIATGRPVKICLDRRRGVHQRQDRSRQAHPHPRRWMPTARHPRARRRCRSTTAYTAYAPTARRRSRQPPCLYRVQTAHYDCDLVYTNKVPGGQYRMERPADHLGDRKPDGRDRGKARPRSAGVPAGPGEPDRRCHPAGLADHQLRPGRMPDRSRAAHRLGGQAREPRSQSRRGHRGDDPPQRRGDLTRKAITPTRASSSMRRACSSSTQTADAGTWQNTTLAQIAAEGAGRDLGGVRVSHEHRRRASRPRQRGLARRLRHRQRHRARGAGAARDHGGGAGAAWRARRPRSFSPMAVPATPATAAARQHRRRSPRCAARSAEAKYKTRASVRTRDWHRQLRRRVCVRRAGGRSRESIRHRPRHHHQDRRGAGCRRALNPVAVERQVYGGVLQGIGMALQEELVFEEGGR
jgi:hypothetical protein